MSGVIDAVNSGIRRCRADTHASGRGFVVGNLPTAGAGAGAKHHVASVASKSTWRGITGALQRVFWPEYDWRKAKGRVVSAGTPTASGSKALSDKRAYAARRGVSMGTAGRHFGVALHAALGLYIPSDGPPRSPKSKPLSTRSILEAQAVLRGLKALGITPIRTEMAFRSARMGLATAVDVLGWHAETEKLYIVELKRGGGGGVFETGSGRTMNGPVPGIPDSLRNQAHLQAVTVAHWLIDEGGVPSNAITTIVLQVNDATQEVSCHRVPDWMWSNRRQLMEYFNSKITDGMRGARIVTASKAKTKAKAKAKAKAKTKAKTKTKPPPHKRRRT